MIQINDKHKCCGCSACVQVCPKQCISFEEDEKGFRYPMVDDALCVDCGLCERTCPVIHQNEPKKPIEVYAAINPDEEIRRKSSSGGVFSLMAENIIKEGGVVFGARFNEQWEVVHDYTESIGGLEDFRGSKYVQSIIGESYRKVKEFLVAGRWVLFSGTSCQIAGLLKFLSKPYDNLLTIDVVCHGVPSPKVWRWYLDNYIFKTVDQNSVSNISFRNKCTGWNNYSFLVAKRTEDDSLGNYKEEVVVSETLEKNLFMQVFLNNLSLRSSCFQCPAKSGKSGSDLTIADYWGIANYHPEWDDNKGTSLLLVNSSKGKCLVKKLSLRKLQTTYEEAYKGNGSIERSVFVSEHSLFFWNTFNEDKLDATFLLKIKPNFIEKVVDKIHSFLQKKYKKPFKFH